MAASEPLAFIVMISVQYAANAVLVCINSYIELCLAGQFNISFQKTVTLFWVCFVCNKVGLKYNFRETAGNVFLPIKEPYFKSPI